MKLENYRSGEYTRIENYKAFILSKINYSWSSGDEVLNKLIEKASLMLRKARFICKTHSKI